MASAPSSLRSLTCSCSGENGVASRSSAPAAATSRLDAVVVVDEQEDLGVARDGVRAQRADELARRAGRARPRRGSRGPAGRRARRRAAPRPAAPPRRRRARRAPRAPRRGWWGRRPASSTRGRRAAATRPGAGAGAGAHRRRVAAAAPARPTDVGTSNASPNAGTGRGVAVSASGPAASITARAADSRSAQVGKRRSGAFSSALPITASSPPGSSGRTDVRRGGGSERCA